MECLKMCGFSAKLQLYRYGKKDCVLQTSGEQRSRIADSHNTLKICGEPFFKTSERYVEFPFSQPNAALTRGTKLAEPQAHASE
jgi:hypothetical protein